MCNPLAKCYNATHEKEKKRSYNQRIIGTENGTFTMLVFACTSGMLRECGKFCSHLADLLVIKKNLNKSTAIGWIVRKNFDIL